MSANPSVDFVPDGVGRPGFAEQEDIDSFVDMLDRFERGDISPDEWRAFRLINGTYGQRQDGVYMLRIKLPSGIASAAQLKTLADVTEKYAGSGVGHVTTRQNIQLHFVKEADAKIALQMLADAGLTTREACGNAVRNVTGCAFAGVAPHEPFDTTPYADATVRHLLHGPFSSSLPRKFKIAFGGCCGFDDVQAQINDLGFLITTDAQGKPGFKVYIGGGLSTLRKAAILVHEFLPVDEVLEVAEAVVRTFHRLGNRKDKHKARIKWVIHKMGASGFIEEYKKDLALVRAEGGRPLKLTVAPTPPVRALPEVKASGQAPLPAYEAFAATNVRSQKQQGFSAVIVRLPKGDITPAQFRALAELVVKYSDGELRTTNEQNVVIRFVANTAIPDLHRDLTAIGLGQGNAMTLADVLSCPGASSCKIAVTNSKALGAILTDHFDAKPELVAQVPGLDVKISGCPNGCGQHYSSVIGLQGGMRKIDGKPVPQYFVYVGGGFAADGPKFGRLAGKVPARRVAAALERLVALYSEEKQPGETPLAFFSRVEPAKVTAKIKDLTEMDEKTAGERDFFDLGEDKAFELVEMEGECAA
jgi:sulfite reductase (NADPH) hemoprotein beta-component